MNILKENLSQTFSSDLNTRKQAENWLKTNEKNQNFILTLLQIIETTQKTEITTKIAGSLYFKNFIIKNWHLSNEESGLSDSIRHEIKKNIVSLILRSPNNIQNILSSALEKICEHDFPKDWQGLAPELIKNISSNDLNIVKGALSIFNSIFKKFRFIQRSYQSDVELEYCSKIVVSPLIEYFKMITSKLQTIENNSSNYCLIMSIFYHIVSIIHSLITHELLHQIENLSEHIFQSFLSLLTFETKITIANDFENTSKLESSQAEICRVLKLFSDKYDDCKPFQTFQMKFVEATWVLLTKATIEVKYDDLVTAAMSFLTSVVTKQWNKRLFDNEASQKLICEKIILPNMKLRDCDIEEFESNPIEYYRRDMEKSDNYTRRRMAVDLVQGLCINFEQNISKILLAYITTLNSQYKSNPDQNWLHKSTALFLVVSVVVKEQTERMGATKVNPQFDVLQFLKIHVFPELSDMEKFPILKADCLRVLLVFRSQLDDQTLLNILPIIIKFLKHKQYVVHTYAARVIEKFVMLRKVSQSNNTHNTQNNTLYTQSKPVSYVFRICLTDLKPNLALLFDSLFHVLSFEDSSENEFVMRAITCVCKRAENELITYVPKILDLIFSTLSKIYKNPTNPQFNHYIFEAISASISSVCSKDSNLVSHFENKLFPIFETLLNTESCVEFQAYVFQILGQMLRYRNTITPVYVKLFPVLLNPVLWRETANSRPLTNLLIAFLNKASSEIIKTNKLEPLLGVFQKLLSQRSNDYNAFAIVISIFEFIPKDQIERFLPEIVRLICVKLQCDKSARFTRRFCVFSSCFIALLGFCSFKKSIELVQKGMFNMLLERIILPNLQFLDTKISRHSCAIGFTFMLCDVEYIREASPSQWILLLSHIINIIELPPVYQNNIEEELEELERAGYSAQYSKLAFARDKEHNPLAKFGDPREFLVKKLENISKQIPGKITEMIKNNLDSKHQNVLNSYFVDLKVKLY